MNSEEDGGSETNQSPGTTTNLETGALSSSPFGPNPSSEAPSYGAQMLMFMRLKKKKSLFNIIRYF